MNTDRIDRIETRLAEIGERLSAMVDRFDRVEGRLASLEEGMRWMRADAALLRRDADATELRRARDRERKRRAQQREQPDEQAGFFDDRPGVQTLRLISADSAESAEDVSVGSSAENSAENSAESSRDEVESTGTPGALSEISEIDLIDRSIGEERSPITDRPAQDDRRRRAIRIRVQGTDRRFTPSADDIEEAREQWPALDVLWVLESAARYVDEHPEKAPWNPRAWMKTVLENAAKEALLPPRPQQHAPVRLTSPPAPKEPEPEPNPEANEKAFRAAMAEIWALPRLKMVTKK